MPSKKRVTEEEQVKEIKDIKDAFSKIDSVTEYTLTEDMFRLFVSECQYWIGKYGLTSWEVHYEFGETENFNRAECHVQVDDFIAIITLPKTWIGTEPSNKMICRSAFHEVNEVLMSTLLILARERFISEDRLGIETHRIIRTFENAVFDDDYDRRAK